MNVLPSRKQDNVATLGHDIDSFWDGKRCSISSTSLATPVAAAIAANVLEFVGREVGEDVASLFETYPHMRQLFIKQM